MTERPMDLFDSVHLLPDGGVRVEITGHERTVLQSLPPQLRQLFAEETLGAPGLEPLRDRLMPAAYADPELDEEYRALVGADLARERVAALDAFEQSLAGGRLDAGEWTVDLTPEQADAWLSAINDARLILGVLAGITEEGQLDEAVGDDPQAALLLYLGWLQEQLVGAMSGTLRGPEPS